METVKDFIAAIVVFFAWAVLAVLTLVVLDPDAYAEGLLCGGEPTSCSPVNDWWCDPSLACLDYVWAAPAEIFAPASLSPLGIPQPWYDHWRASLDNLTAHQYELELWRTGQLRYKEPDPEPELPTTCDVWHDWNGGDLWKPVSDNTGNPVFLVGGQFAGARCGVFTNEEEIPGCRFRTVANGGRAHFDVPYRCTELERHDPLIVGVALNGVGHCWRVEDACTRYE